ncbi:hypothetical protein HK107_05510 [Parvularcula sp. ZS-1/3]|uniref:Uncharacterized protein n=1 Tax=Parvularcula mediterranea TaxID=2732508 RepID=A0A7Y3RLJ9_9PROT|nr:hypothetical protein [Parvularcula mediterranea]NNU15776.1 hypothetical protein [Parvularcula mediterranea]
MRELPMQDDSTMDRYRDFRTDDEARTQATVEKAEEAKDSEAKKDDSED